MRETRPTASFFCKSVFSLQNSLIACSRPHPCGGSRRRTARVLRTLLGDLKLLVAREVDLRRTLRPPLPDLGDASPRLRRLPPVRHGVRGGVGVALAEARALPVIKSSVLIQYML